MQNAVEFCGQIFSGRNEKDINFEVFKSADSLSFLPHVC